MIIRPASADDVSALQAIVERAYSVGRAINATLDGDTVRGDGTEIKIKQVEVVW